MKKHSNKSKDVLHRDGYFYIAPGALNVSWPGTQLGHDFKIMNGLKVLPEDFRRKVQKAGYDVLLVFWPEKKSDSYIDLTNKMTFIFCPKGDVVKIAPWDPWDATASPTPTIGLDGSYKVVELHKLEQYEYCGAYARWGYSPLSFERDITKYVPAIINPNTERVYFGKANREILKFLKK